MAVVKCRCPRCNYPISATKIGICIDLLRAHLQEIHVRPTRLDPDRMIQDDK